MPIRISLPVTPRASEVSGPAKAAPAAPLPASPGWLTGLCGPRLEHFQRPGVQRRREFRVQGGQRVAIQVDRQGRAILVDVLRPA
jgi:hypothetical protein